MERRELQSALDSPTHDNPVIPPIFLTKERIWLVLGLLAVPRPPTAPPCEVVASYLSVERGGACYSHTAARECFPPSSLSPMCRGVCVVSRRAALSRARWWVSWSVARDWPSEELNPLEMGGGRGSSVHPCRARHPQGLRMRR